MDKLREVKDKIKEILASRAIINPALGVKISQKEKAEKILKYKTQVQNIFVETGTYKGEMIDFVEDKFEKVYSIELDKILFDDATQRFSGNTNIKVLLGNSGEKIREVITELHQPALFWLDAHGTGPMSISNGIHCPIREELEAIFSQKNSNHIILIDDVRLFDRKTINFVNDIATKNNFSSLVEDGLFILRSK